MRLIDADNFEKELSSVWKWLADRDKKGYGTTHGEMLDKVHDILIKQPTAYDIDKVVEELEENYFQEGIKTPMCIELDKAIKIVKDGVKNEQILL